jgi:hypothetical protein
VIDVESLLARHRRNRLVDLIRRHGGRLTARELQRANGKRYPKVADAEGALRELVRAGLARWVHLFGTSCRYRNKVVSAVQLCDLSDSDLKSPCRTSQNDNGEKGGQDEQL